MIELDPQRRALRHVRDAVSESKAKMVIALDAILDALDAILDALEEVAEASCAPDVLLTRDEAAKRLGIGRMTFNAYVSREQIAVVQLPAGIGTRPIYRFRTSDVDALLTRSQGVA